jgi:hypothetical protein
VLFFNEQNVIHYRHETYKVPPEALSLLVLPGPKSPAVSAGAGKRKPVLCSCLDHHLEAKDMDAGSQAQIHANLCYIYLFYSEQASHTVLAYLSSVTLSSNPSFPAACSLTLFLETPQLPTTY